LKLKRTHNCGELRASDIGNEVILNGWVKTRRDPGGIIFIDLRDRDGVTQIAFDEETAKDAHGIAEAARTEYVIAVKGKVFARPEGTVNRKLPTGEVEMYIDEVEILNAANTPPFIIEDDSDASDLLKLKYRYLDLRRPVMQKALMDRHRLTRTVRNFLDGERFVDVETPMLTKSTPEGARDYLVPSRVNMGKFYALPQSPQLFKQILMVSGMDKYYQVVKCFRDEDLRADRQPEFTQIDLEMSFVDAEDVMDVAERMMAAVFKEMKGQDIETPFPRLTYAEAVGRYGLDKPDTRYGLELVDMTDIVRNCGFQVMKGAVESGGMVKGMNAKGLAGMSRKELEDMTEYAKVYGAKGMAWMKFTENGIESPIKKFFTEDILKAITDALKPEPGDLMVFIADKIKVVNETLGHLRIHVAEKTGIIDDSRFNFAWITEFPQFEYNEDEKRYESMHHPFTAPYEEDMDKLKSDPESVRSIAYDLVLNGSEIGGGSIRIHKPEIQKIMFDALGIGEEEAAEKFGFLLDALQFGAPPHGGLAFGLDRLAMILLGADSIRDVIAFPKTQKATCLMTDAPSGVAKDQLRDLHIKLNALNK
jgi:aspartyl-tRNA synthetase